MTLMDKLIEYVEALPYDLQWRVLEYARALSLGNPQESAGHRLLHFAGTIPPDDLAVMQEAIEQACEQIDPHEW